MKTSLSGSRCGASSRQAWRAAATSGLSCSAACTLFFEGDGVAIEEPPDRARRKRGPLLSLEQLSDLHKGQIRLLFDRDRKSTRLNSSHTVISYAVFCLKKKKQTDQIARDSILADNSRVVYDSHTAN